MSNTVLDYGARTAEVLSQIGQAKTIEDAITSLFECARALDADAAVFTSCLRSDLTQGSFRSLLACDPAWASDYARGQWFECDPWLRHAAEDSEPVLASGIPARSAAEEQFMQGAARHGFASALVAPAPDRFGASRVAVLCLGSRDTGHFEQVDSGVLGALARALAMELHRWLLRWLALELQTQARLTDADLDLLRHEAAGHGSKFIASTLALEPKTIDCRFQRVCAKLGAPNRRIAAHLARVHGLI